jgi:hypothetical protein
MKTRTLLLLALGCGLAIMLAGAVFLVQLTNQEDVAEPVPLGEPARVGDMTVVVDGSTEAAGELRVDIRIGGVDDPDGADGFRLIAAGEAIPRSSTSAGDVDACSATSVAERSCVLRFDVGDASGASRVLFYDRGDDGARWVLA